MIYTDVNPHRQEQSWATLALLCVAQFMVVLDITIVNVALPSIGSALGFAKSDLQWVVTAYVVCSGGLLLVAARIGDRFGRRRAFSAGLALFSAASLASGLAPSPSFLIASRALQGVGASLLTSSALAIVTSVYTGEQRAKAQTIWGGIASAGIGVGVIAGGVLTTALSWEWIFLINVPVGLAALVLAPRVVPRMAANPSARPLDLPGAVTVVLGLSAIVYSLSRVPDYGWSSAEAIMPLAVGAALLAVFIAIERSVRRPLLPMSVWRVRPLVAGAALILGITGLLAGFFYLNSLYDQTVLGWSALETGFGFLPFVVAIGIGIHGSGHVLQHLGARGAALVGLGLVVAAGIQMALAPDHATYLTEIAPGYVVFGAGVGIAFPAIQIATMAGVDHDSAGVASGLTSTAHEIGAALGIAVLSAVAVAGSGKPAAGLLHGYGTGSLAVAVIAAGFAGLAALTMTSFRPAPGARLSVH